MLRFIILLILSAITVAANGAPWDASDQNPLQAVKASTRTSLLSTDTHFQSSITTDTGTIVSTRTSYEGYRVGFFTLRPRVGVITSQGFAAYGQVPFSWLTDQNGVQDRLIGRPEVGFHRESPFDHGIKISGGLGVKLPLYDTSFGRSEMYRYWQVAPQGGAEFALGSSPLHAVAGGSLAYDSDSHQTFSSVSQATGETVRAEQTISRPLTLRGSLGMTLNLQALILGARLRSVNSLGQGKETLLSQNATTSEVYEIGPVNSLSGEVFGSCFLAQNLSVSGSVIKGIKNNYSSIRPYLMSYDDFTEIASLAFSVGIARSF